MLLLFQKSEHRVFLNGGRAMISKTNPVILFYQSILSYINQLQSVFSLLLRGWLAQVFFMSGLTKIQNWQTTLMLFEYEYAVPVISFELAAWLATGAELLIPILLIVGALTRPAALALLILNFVAMTSYPDISAAGTNEHMMWGFMIASLFFYGAGKLSLDYLIARKITE